MRRLLRPAIFIQSSSMMKKLLKSVFLTIPEVLSALLLLLFHLYFFTMIGMLVLPTSKKNDDGVFQSPTGFERLDTAIVSLLVLLTTGNSAKVIRNQGTLQGEPSIRPDNWPPIRPPTLLFWARE